jgi:hypothetical protein
MYAAIEPTAENLYLFGKVATASFVTGIEGSDCTYRAAAMHDALAELGIASDIIGGGIAARFGPKPHHVIYSFPLGWCPIGSEQFDEAAGFLGHAWLRVGNLCIDTSTSWRLMGQRLYSDDLQLGREAVGEDDWPLPDVAIFDASYRAERGSICAVTQPRSPIGVSYRRDTELTVRVRGMAAQNRKALELRLAASVIANNFRENLAALKMDEANT